MFTLQLFECIVVIIPIAAAVALTIVRKERLWMHGRKLEEIVFRIEALNMAISDLFDTVKSIDSALVHVTERRGLARIESKLAELKLQVKIYFPQTLPRLGQVLASLSSAYEMLDRLGRADPMFVEAAMEGVDLSVCALRFALDALRHELIHVSHGGAASTRIVAPKFSAGLTSSPHAAEGVF